MSDASYLNLAAEVDYSSVGSILWNEAGLSYLGSGTYIGGGWILTAAHVADGTDYAGNGMSNWRFTIDGATYYADEYVVHPDWTNSQGDLDNGSDLALVRLSVGSIDVSPAVLYEYGDEKGRTATMVGYGATGTGSTGYSSNSSGTKRAGTNMIDAVGGDRRVLLFNDNIMFVDFDNPTSSTDNVWGSASPLELEYMTAPGDSGGGLFIDVGGVNYLAGVTSFGRAYDAVVDSDYGDIGGYIRISQYIDWIDEITGLISRADCSFK